MPTFAVVMGLAALLATVLHGLEAATWAIAYLLLGALPNTKSAMLYLLSAMTSYGHANLFLEEVGTVVVAKQASNIGRRSVKHPRGTGRFVQATLSHADQFPGLAGENARDRPTLGAK